jgi:hypothetical protein
MTSSNTSSIKISWNSVPHTCLKPRTSNIANWKQVSKFRNRVLIVSLYAYHLGLPPLAMTIISRRCTTTIKQNEKPPELTMSNLQHERNNIITYCNCKRLIVNQRYKEYLLHNLRAVWVRLPYNSTRPSSDGLIPLRIR